MLPKVFFLTVTSSIVRLANQAKIIRLAFVVARDWVFSVFKLLSCDYEVNGGGVARLPIRTLFYVAPFPSFFSSPTS
jgi:hypothetical protein